MNIIFTRKGLPEQSENDLENSNNLKIVLICSGTFYIYYKKKKQSIHTREMLIIPLELSFYMLPKKPTRFKPKLLALQINLLNCQFWFSQTFVTVGLELKTIKLQMRDFVHLMKLLRWTHHYLKYQTSNDRNQQMIDLVEKFITKTICKIILNNTNHHLSNTNKINFTWKFMKALEKHHAKEHKVIFYASLLCISEGYLNKILKETTTKSTKQNIDEFLIFQAKRLLLNKNWTILQISHELGFSCPSHFSNFFLKHQGTRPSLFKHQNESIIPPV